MTALHLDPCLPGNVPLAESPAMFVLQQSGQYAHLPRSVSDGDNGQHATLWCGQIAFLTGSNARVQARWSATPADRPICGTCVGRRLGYDPTVADVAFRPTRTLDDLSRRVWCPGPGCGLVDERAGCVATCLLCGAEGRMRAGGGWSRPTWKMEAHHPASLTALVYCPSCGYRNLRADGRRVHCSSWRCDWTVTL